MVAYKTTKKEFSEFKTECWKWIEYFGLKDWEWDIRHETPSQDDARANYNLVYVSKYVCVRLNKTFTVAPDKYEIKRCAFHEIIHVLISELSRFGLAVYRDEVIEKEEHRIIQILENSLFNDSI
jgi:hypothetical protein